MPSSAELYTFSLHDALPILLAGLGSGFDIVSGGELERLRTAGVPGDRIVFSGVGKTREEIREALQYPSRYRDAGRGILLFNIDRKSTRLNSSHTVISYAVFCRVVHFFPTRRSSDLACRTWQRLRHRVRRGAGATPNSRRARRSNRFLRRGQDARGDPRSAPISFSVQRRRSRHPALQHRSEEHTSELQSHSDLVCRLLPSCTLFPYTTLFRSCLPDLAAASTSCPAGSWSDSEQPACPEIESFSPAWARRARRSEKRSNILLGTETQVAASCSST